MSCVSFLSVLLNKKQTAKYRLSNCRHYIINYGKKQLKLAVAKAKADVPVLDIQ